MQRLHLKEGFLILEAMGLVAVATIIFLVFLRGYADLIQQKALATEYIKLVDTVIAHAEQQKKGKVFMVNDYLLSKAPITFTQPAPAGFTGTILSVKAQNGRAASKYRLPLFVYDNKSRGRKP